MPLDRPVLLDLFCCAGGAAVGYHRAGFDVVGVDIKYQRRYPFAFVKGNALEVGHSLLTGDHPFSAVHASPPCQAHTDLAALSSRQHHDYLPYTRELLQAAGLPYIIENVEGAPLFDPIRLCGAMFPELRVYRHRLFESNVRLEFPDHPKHTALVYTTHDKRKYHMGQPMTPEMFVNVTGGGNAPLADKRRAMGIDWMTEREINEAIPPAYTEYLGRQLMAVVQQEAAA